MVLVQHGKLPSLIGFANNGRYINTDSALQEIAQLQDRGLLGPIGDEEFRKRFWGRLDNATFDRLDAARQALRKGQQSPEERLDALLIEAELLPVPGTPDRLKDAELLKRAWRLKNAIYGAADAQGVKDPKGILDIGRRMIADKAWNSVGTDRLLPLEAMTPDERKTAYVETSAGDRYLPAIQAIPPEDLARIDANLRAEGKQPTEQARLEYYATVAPARKRALAFLDGVPTPELQAAVQAVSISGADARDPEAVQRQVERAREVRRFESRRAERGRDPLSVERFLPQRQNQ